MKAAQGVIVIEGGTVLTVDEARILPEANAGLVRVLDRIGGFARLEAVTPPC